MEGGGGKKDSEVVLHIHREVFTYSARNNWILEETRDPGSEGPESSSHQALYAAIDQQKGEVHNFAICTQTEQLTLVNCNILNICKTTHTAIPERLKLLVNIPFCPWKKVKAYSHLTANECKARGAWGKQTLRSADLAPNHYKTGTKLSRVAFLQNTKKKNTLKLPKSFLLLWGVMKN